MNILSFHFSSAAETVAILAVACALGTLLGRINFFNVSIGAGGVLFSSLLLGHLGFQLEPHLAEIIRDCGLALFVYAVGIQIAPAFFASFKKDGIKLNLLAMLIILTGFIISLILFFATGLEIAKIAGIMSGAVTNTPGLAAAQEILNRIYNGDKTYSDLCAAAYAVTYPFGIFGIILAIILLQKIFHINLDRERKTFHSELTIFNTSSKNCEDRIDLFALCLGIFLGILLGMIAVKIPSVPVPLKLGSAGGPLIVALILGKIQKIGKINWCIPLSTNFALREIGISLFLACVGLRSGAKFAEAITSSEGIIWFILGALITFLPLFIFGFVAIKFLKLNFLSVCGLLSGSMTDPPALAFSETFTKSEIPAISFTSVYALTMLLRIIFAQILIIFFH